jgi:hypothetical protein
MTGDEIIQAVLSEHGVFLHYTDDQGLRGILYEGVLRPDYKGVVYLTQEPMTQAEAHTNLFIGATTHSGRATHLLVLRLDIGLPIRPLNNYEFRVDQNIKLHQHEVLYAGLNPF